MNDAPFATWMSATSRSGTCCPSGVATQDVADLLRRLAILRLQPHDEIERALALHDLRRRRAADRGLDQPVHRRRRSGRSARSSRDRRSIVRLGCPSSCTSVTCSMPGTRSMHRLDLRAPSASSSGEVGAEDLHVERALEPGLRLVDRVLGRLRVVERDARETPRASCAIAAMSSSFAWIRAVPLAVRLEPDVELGVEESGRIGAGVVAAVLRRDDRDLGKAAAGSRGPAARCFDDSSNEIVYGIVARTQSAPSSSFGMNSPPRVERDDAAETREQRDRRDDRRRAVRAGTSRARARSGRASTRTRGSAAPSRRRRSTHDAQHRNDGQRERRAIRAARRSSCPPSGGTACPTGRSARRSAGSPRRSPRSRRRSAGSTSAAASKITSRMPVLRAVSLARAADRCSPPSRPRRRRECRSRSRRSTAGSPECASRSRQMNANSSASGIVTATISPDAQVVEEEDQHDDDEHDAAQQVVAPPCAS